MNLDWKRAAAAGALCLGMAAAAAAGAQDRPPPGPGGPPPAGGRSHGPDRQKMFEQMRARREQRLHDLLEIRPDQDAAFHAFVTAMTPPERGDKDHHGHGPGGPEGPDSKPPMTTPERLDKMAARMAERQQRFQQMLTATKTFYAALTPEQRKAFDELPPMMHGGHGHEGHRGFWRGPGGPGGRPPMGPPPPPGA